MQLLYSSAICSVQYASLSILFKPSIGCAGVVPMVEPLLLPSINSTISYEQLISSLRELHLYLTDVLSAASTNTQLIETQNSVVLDLLREDERYLTDNNMQLFHPATSPGIGIQYRVIRNQNNNDNKLLVSQLATLILSSNRPNDAGPAKIDPSIGLFGILITIGSTGIPYGLCSNSLQSTLEQRLNYVLSLLSTNTKLVEDPSAAKDLVFNFLVLDDELRKNNQRMATPDKMIIPESTTSTNTRNNILSPMGMMSPMNMMSPIADIAGLVVRKGARAGGGNTGNLGNDGGTSNQQEIGFSLAPLEKKSAIATRLLVERLRILSVAENDSKLRKYETTGAERKANYFSEVFGNSTNTKSRFRRPTRKGEKADFDNFDYKGPAREASTLKSTATSTSFSNTTLGGASTLKVATSFPILAPPAGSTISETPSSINTTGKLTLKSSKKDTTTRRTTAANSRRNINQGPSFADDESTGQQPNRRVSVESSSVLSKTKRTTKTVVPDDAEKSQLSSSHGTDGNSVNSGNPQSSISGTNSNITLNVALNEDLTCSYKTSLLQSCVVEGFVQVSIKADSLAVNQTPGSTAFAIILRDSMKQIESISENKKVVQDVTRLTDNNAYKLVVNVPKFDTYFALLKYKCNADLRPVPIRVQTKVKVEDGVCRVALQISSNPSNSGSLTDLTIMMAVPDNVIGQSLTTQPSGGLWDEVKSSVIWCVAELGSGEKFQLLARFDVKPDTAPGSDLYFPVLVRSQCLFSQLSAIQIEVQNVSNTNQPDISTKIARRYRLSHRERND